MKPRDGISLSMQKMTLLLNRKSMKHTNRRTTRETMSFMCVAQAAIGRSNLAGHNPTVVGAYFPWSVLISFLGNLAGTQIFGFLATEGLAQDGRWPAMTYE